MSTSFLQPWVLIFRKSHHLPFPLPPFREQQRIVGKIEELFTKLDAGVDELKKAKARLRKYRLSLLASAFTGEILRESRGGFDQRRVLEFRSVIDSLDQGWSPKCENQPSDNPETWGVIKTTAVQPLHFLEIENKQLPGKLKPRVNLEIISGDMLMTRAGPRKRVGICCLVRNVRERLMICDKVYRIRLNINMVDPRYIEFITNSPQFLDALEEIKTGINDSGVNITQERLLSIQIPVPPLDLQMRIIQTVEAQISICNSLQRAIEDSMTRANGLNQAILMKAFQGKLVPQDPKDEPAEKLLERIRQSIKQSMGQSMSQTSPGKKKRKPRGASSNGK